MFCVCLLVFNSNHIVATEFLEGEQCWEGSACVCIPQSAVEPMGDYCAAFARTVLLCTPIIETSHIAVLVEFGHKVINECLLSSWCVCPFGCDVIVACAGRGEMLVIVGSLHNLHFFVGKVGAEITEDGTEIVYGAVPERIV